MRLVWPSTRTRCRLRSLRGQHIGLLIYGDAVRPDDMDRERFDLQVERLAQWRLEIRKDELVVLRQKVVHQQQYRANPSVDSPMLAVTTVIPVFDTCIARELLVRCWLNFAATFWFAALCEHRCQSIIGMKISHQAKETRRKSEVIRRFYQCSLRHPSIQTRDPPREAAVALGMLQERSTMPQTRTTT